MPNTTVNGKNIEYIRFGSGKKVLVMIPGLSDGLKTVKGTTIPVSLSYRDYTREHTVYMFSRPDTMEEGCSMRQMAQELYTAMRNAGIEKADILGVSQGGMIAQWMVADHPDIIDRLVLAVTAPKASEMAVRLLDGWIRMAERGDYRRIMTDTALKSYTPRYLKKNGAALALAGKIGRPKSFDRFIIQAKACKEHDALEVLGSIKAPTLVIGGTIDAIVGPEGSYELARRIPGARLLMLEGYGHRAYTECKDFDPAVRRFLRGEEVGEIPKE